MDTFLLIEPEGFSLSKVLIVMWPACLVGLAVAALVESRWGRNLDDEPVFQQRLAEGLIKPSEDTVATGDLPPNAKRAALIFLTGVALIVILGLFSDLRPSVGQGDGVAQVSITFTIQVVMGVVAAVILLLPGVKGSEVAYKILFAVALFLTAALTTSQSGATRAIVPIGLTLGLSAASITAMWPAVMGIYFLPANGSQIATVAFDQTGTTKIGKAVLNHSFLLPTMIFVVVGTVVGFMVSPLV